MTFIEVVKDVAAVIGLIISCFTVLALFSDRLKKWVANIFSKYNQEQDTDIKELKEAVNGLTEKMDVLMAHDAIVLEFTKQQCRNIVKEIFYKYCDDKILPLYEYKTLIYIEDIYINQLQGNSYASELISRMKTWQVDCTSARLDEE